MKVNKIRLLEMNAETGLIKNGAKKPANLFDYALNTEPTEIKKLELNDDNLKEARKWLSSKKNTCERTEGYSGAYYKVTAYAIEYLEENEDGDFVDGSDYDSADDEIYDEEDC